MCQPLLELKEKLKESFCAGGVSEHRAVDGQLPVLLPVGGDGAAAQRRRDAGLRRRDAARTRRLLLRAAVLHRVVQVRVRTTRSVGHPEIGWPRGVTKWPNTPNEETRVPGHFS